MQLVQSYVSQYSHTCKSDLDKSVNDIQLVEPAPSEITTDPEYDPQLAGVTFEPIRVGSPEMLFNIL